MKLSFEEYVEFMRIFVD